LVADDFQQLVTRGAVGVPGDAEGPLVPAAEPGRVGARSRTLPMAGGDEYPVTSISRCCRVGSKGVLRTGWRGARYGDALDQLVNDPVVAVDGHAGGKGGG
jgi:hypothetical protein